MQHTQSLMYIGNLLDKKIVTAEGKRIGHVADIELTPNPPYKVTALFYGKGGWQHRLHLLNPFTKTKHPATQPDTIPWDAIERIEKSRVTLKSGYNAKDRT